jgi:macrolide transport system ATP-binding/permease protein
MRLIFNHVSFTYNSAAQTLFEDAHFHLSAGWTGIIGANGSGKTTLLRLITGEIHPQSGHVDVSDRWAFCPQRTDTPPPELVAFLAESEREVSRLRGQLRIPDDCATRWRTLSHGERKRVQIAVALWRRPEILLVDEPTNHLDGPARQLVGNALASFRGIGVMVSHNRGLLDKLCDQCLFIAPPVTELRVGNFSRASLQKAQERESCARDRKHTRQELKKLTGTQQRRRQEAAGADRKRSRRGIHKKDHDAKERIGRARNTGKDGRAGALTRQLDGRIKQLTGKLSRTIVDKQHRMGVQLSGHRAKQRLLLSMPEGNLALGATRRLSHPPLFIFPDDRIGVIGDNGAGKSTLIDRIIFHLTISPEEMVYVPQEISPDDGARIAAQVCAMPHDMQGQLLTIVNRLGTRPERLRETIVPSPGETRKLLLAMGIVRSPSLIVMDEPTNHLDLPAVQALEDALEDCPAALLLVSHDLAFLRRLTHRTWHVRNDWLIEALTLNDEIT